MDAELKKKWVEALRSGKYEKGYAQLRNELGRMCCLGVLREILAPGSEEKAEDGDAEYLSDSMSAQAGIEPYDAYREELEGVQRTLARMNDSGDSFAKIADWIEANL